MAREVAAVRRVLARPAVFLIDALPME